MQYLNGKRYYTMAQYCRESYGGRIIKLPLFSGFSCPNRDGTRAVGGCVFCLGDAVPAASLAEQWQQQCSAVKKWQSAKPFGYFQSFSNTHCSAEQLASLLDQAKRLPGIAGIRLATRADCIDSEKADILAEFSRQMPLEIELGLQTAHDKTAETLNRAHSFEEFCGAVSLLSEKKLYICVHLINGLPNETEAMMLQSARAVSRLKISGIKLHMLHLLMGTPLQRRFSQNPFPLLSQQQYTGIVCRQIAALREDIVIERLTGDGDRALLLAPEWTKNKRNVLNGIDKRLAGLNIRQGDLYEGEGY